MGRKDRRNFKKGGGGSGRRSNNNRNWVSIEKENAAWESFYKEQNIPPVEEFEEFKKSCQSDLPLTFRITGSKKHAIQIREAMEKDYIPTLKDIVWDGEPVDPPKPLAFYPDNLGWEIKVGKQVIRKNKAFGRMQRFLVVETDVGNISRQEAVSMIPPLLLDVQPYHTVLDMCAAPGSKTAQLVEAIHGNPEVPRPSGFVVANDSDYKRSHMLIHQVKRLNSPNLVVTNHDAQFYPKIKTGAGDYLKFDRVLCDVPCSGDGTMRKNVNVWKDWTIGNALGLHATQVNIMQRGVQLLKPGGRIVYSTCSLNPIENEAVVAEVLRLNKGNLQLVDAKDELPGLIAYKGVSTWKVQGKDKEWKQPGDEGMANSLFPPTEEEASNFNLDRCIRVYPHQQDTGGFFISVFEKKDNNNNNTEKKRAPEGESSEQRPEKVPKSTEQQAATTAATEKKDKLPRDALEEPFKFLAPDHPTLKECWDFYGISEGFPRDSLLVRNATGEPVRTIYYVAPELRPILQENESRLKFVHSGIKMFAQQKNDGNCKWRVQSEGLHLLYPYASPKRVVRMGKVDSLRELCVNTFPKLEDVQKIDEELYSQVKELDEGCCFLEVPFSEVDGDIVVYPMWRGRSSLNIMLPKQDTQELLHRVFKIENVKGEAKPQSESSVAPESAKESETATPATEEPKQPEESDAPTDEVKNEEE
ncbi:hypothetical protein TRICI_006805 [Trichomonascus ciferrii]|uniref:SAM-dependent MTase RsmB/NOP-type domain-containing protein n=1 Tax=Trichomonascus ciferrii TaxID=44093 RepID=A0A642UDE6_9ASCO|nr:hypothetical protein TRICI_006805 [Trichomonascus ciferrii]